MNSRLLLTIVALFGISVGQEALAQNSPLRFRGTVGSSWHENDNWSRRFVPVARILNESALVEDGKVATVERLAPEVVNLTIDEAHVIIEQNGVLPVRNRVSVSSGGSLTVGGRLSATDITSLGTLVLDVTNEPELDISGVLTAGGTIEIKSSAIPAGEQLQLARVEEFVDAGVRLRRVGRSVDPAVEYSLVYSEGALSLASVGAPHVLISRATGRAVLQHSVGDPVSLTGYTLRSSSGQLLHDAWRPIGQTNADWFPASPTSTAISELSVNGQLELEAGQRIDLGHLAPASNGPQSEDISWHYGDAEGNVRDGNAAYVGVANNVFLQVEPATGEATLRFLSSVVAPPEIEAYQIASDENQLLPTGWQPLAGRAGDWEETSSSTSIISESLPAGGLVFGRDTEFSLGAIFAGEPLGEISFSVQTTDGEIHHSSVFFSDPLAGLSVFDCNFDTIIDVFDANCTLADDMTAFLLGTGVLPADANGDQSVDFADFLIVSQNFSQAGQFTDGDFDRSGTVDFADFLTLSGSFGATTGASGEPVSVPEPAIWMMLLAVTPCIQVLRRRRTLVILFVLIAASPFGTREATANEFDIRFLDIEPLETVFQIESVERARQLLAGPVIGATVQHDIVSTVPSLAIGGIVGRFPEQNPYPAPDSDDFVYHATATMHIPAGDWTLVFGSDDGGYVRMPGVQFLETWGEQGPIVAGDGEIIYSRPRAYRFTSGTFSVADGGMDVSFDSAFYERGDRDGFEVIIAQGHQEDPSPHPSEGWQILQNGVLGWQVLSIENQFDFDADGAVGFGDFLRLASNFEQYGAQPQGDTNHDGFIDLYDFVAFREALTNSPQGEPAAVSVPEPTMSWALCIGFLFCLRVCTASKNRRVAVMLLLLTISLGHFADESHAQNAQIQSRWLTAVDGTWHTNANWSTEMFPQFGNINATIDAVGAPYRVTVPPVVENVDINAVFVLSPDAILEINGVPNFTTRWLELSGSRVELSRTGVFARPGRGPLTIVGSGTVSMGDSSIHGGVLIREGIAIETNGGDNRFVGEFENRGTVRIGPEARVEIDQALFSNEGVIDVLGSLDVEPLRRFGEPPPLWRNDGSIVLREGSNFFLYADIDHDSLNGVVDEGAESVVVTGILNNEGNSFNFETSFDIQNLQIQGLRGGTLQGNGTALTYPFSSLRNGVTMEGEFELHAREVGVENGLTLDNATIEMVGTPSLNFYGSNQTLAGTGQIIAAGELRGESLVIGPDVSVRTATDGTRDVRLTMMRNEGTIILDSDTHMRLFGQWTNAGQITVNAGTLVLNTLDADRIGSIQNNGGTIEAYVNHVNQGTISASDVWTYAGTIRGGSMVSPDGIIPKFRNLTLEDVQFSGGANVLGGLVVRGGEFDLAGGTVTLKSNASLSLLQPVVGTGTILFDADGRATLNTRGADETALALGAGTTLRVRGTDHEVEARNLVLNGSLELENNSHLEISADSLTTAGETVIGEGATLEVYVTNEFRNSGRIVLEEGLLTTSRRSDALDAIENSAEGVIEGDGVLRMSVTKLTNFGTLGPGDLLIQTNVDHQVDATMRFDIAGTQEDAYDSFLVTADLAMNGGDLSVSFVDDFLPTIGDEFTIVYANSIEGQFGQKESLAVGDFLFDILYGDDTITLRAQGMSPMAAPVPEPASALLLLSAIAMLSTIRQSRI